MENVGLSDDEVESNSGDSAQATQHKGTPARFSFDEDLLVHELSLNRSSWGVIAGIGSLWALVLYLYPMFSLAYPMFFVPFAYLVYRSQRTQVVMLNDTIRSFGMAFCLAPLFLLFLALFLFMIFPILNQTGSIYLMLWIIICGQVAAEETFKYKMIQKKVEIDETASIEIRQLQYMDLCRCLFTAMALSLGYGTYQGLATSALLSVSSRNFIEPLVISVVMAALYIPSHVMTGYLIGLQLGRRTVLNENIPTITIVIWPVIYRSTFLFQIFFWAGMTSYAFIGWVMSSCVLILAFAYYIRHVKQKLPVEYLDLAGYNAILGYLPIIDDGA